MHHPQALTTGHDWTRSAIGVRLIGVRLIDVRLIDVRLIDVRLIDVRRSAQRRRPAVERVRPCTYG